MSITIAEVIEQCAQACEGFDACDPSYIAIHIRALAEQYEGCIVADGEVERYKSVAHSHGTDLATRWEYIPLYRAREAK
jgi:hypothetical protein